MEAGPGRRPCARTAGSAPYNARLCRPIARGSGRVQGKVWHWMSRAAPTQPSPDRADGRAFEVILVHAERC